jgi:arylsulfatase A
MQTPTHLHFRFLIGIICLISASHPHAYAVPEARRNIVFVFCDGLSYGEIQALNPERGKIPAPAANTLADEGIIFTDAHSGSSVCTPTRYGLMTGRYSWRTWLQRGVVKGFAPKLIAKDRPTVPGFPREIGYHTAIIGKWHLNFQ